MVFIQIKKSEISLKSIDNLDSMTEATNKIYFFKFKKNISRHIKIEIRNKKRQVELLFSQKKWTFKSEQEMILGTKIIQQMQESKCRSFKLSGAKFNIHDTIRVLNIPKFNKLAQLILHNCLITNIQSITFLDAPQIKYISVGRNKISVGRSVHKWCFSELQQIQLNSNLIQQSWYLSRMKINTISDSYLYYMNSFMKTKSKTFKNIVDIKYFVNMYRFNTKTKIPRSQQIQNNALLESLFIEDISFYAKLELSSHLIDHVQINQNQNCLKFDSKKRRNFHSLQQKQMLQKNQNLIKENSRKGEQVSAIQDNPKENSTSNISSIPQEIGPSSQTFRYLNDQEKKVLQNFLILKNLKPLKLYQTSDRKLDYGRLTFDGNQVETNRKKMTFIRIQQIKKVQTLLEKFTLGIHLENQI